MKKVPFLFLTAALLSALVGCQTPDEKLPPVVTEGATEAVHETETEPVSEIPKETTLPSVDSIETEVDTPVSDETFIENEGETITQSSANDAFCSPAPTLYESMEEFLDQWWEKEIPNPQGILEGFIVVPNLNLDGYKLRSVLATSHIFNFNYVPAHYQNNESVDASEIITIEYTRWDYNRETGTFDRSFPFIDEYHSGFFLVKKREIIVTFPDAIMPKTVADMEKILTFEVHYAPETTPTAETDAVQ